MPGVSPDVVPLGGNVNRESFDMNLSENLTEKTLLLRLSSTEHDFVERKPRSARSDWLQTAVAFANSAPIGWPAVLFVGVDDDGKPQQGQEKLEDLAKRVAGVLDQAYPAIYRHVVPLNVEDELWCLAVIIPGSEQRPHFAGQSYVRVGPETLSASSDQFDQLVASRNSKTREFQQWAGKEVSITRMLRRGSDNHYVEQVSNVPTDVVSCGPLYATFLEHHGSGSRKLFSVPLEKIQISFDHPNKRLAVFLYADR
jgi:hypothetical protein